MSVFSKFFKINKIRINNKVVVYSFDVIWFKS